MTRAQAEQGLHAKLSIELPNADGPTGCAVAEIEGREYSFSDMIESGQVTRVDLGRTGTTSAIKTLDGIV